MGEDDPTTCEECGLTYFYDPKLHECADKGLQPVVTTTWVEECMAKQHTKPNIQRKDCYMSEQRHCCAIIDGVDCDQPAEFRILTQRNSPSRVAGPDPYSDETEGCVGHLGILLGTQPDMVRPDEAEWLLIPIRPVVVSDSADATACNTRYGERYGVDWQYPVVV